MFDVKQSPAIVIWEVTRACALNCIHCRAKAQFRRDPRELSTAEGKALLRQIKDLGSPIFVFTGGDPLMREDLFELAAYGKEIGLSVSITPSATPRVTETAMKRAMDIGFNRWAFSLDGSTKEIHDAFRGTAGSYDLTMRSLEVLKKLGMPIQINTTACRYNIDDLPRIVEVIQEFGVVLWSVFFLVPTGRGKIDDMLTAEEHEQVFRYLNDLSTEVSFDIKTTAAPHYKRLVIQHRGTQGVLAKADKIMRNPWGITDGKGFVFISHTGDICPSGFLPLTCGNIREQALADIYRNHPTFQALQNPDVYKGKCGVCEFRHLCGGSRARAYAMTGDYLESDPSCVYIPQTLREA